MLMNRAEMIEALIPVVVQSGQGLVAARQRLWRMSTAALHRELLLHGLLEYEDPPLVDDEDDIDQRLVPYLFRESANQPRYSD